MCVDAYLPPSPSLSIFLQAAAGVAAAKPSFAAYGDSANVWGSITNDSGECAATQKIMLTGMGKKMRGWRARESIAGMDIDVFFFFRREISCTRSADEEQHPERQSRLCCSGVGRRTRGSFRAAAGGGRGRGAGAREWAKPEPIR